MSEDNEPEIWLPIVGSPGYEVSSFGRVRSLDRIVRGRNGTPRPIKGRILAQALIGHPGNMRPAVCLGRLQQRGVHVIVCETFHGPKPTRQHEAAHWDGDPFNNRDNNLRWATPVENAADRTRHGRTYYGEKNGSSKLTEADIRDISHRLASGHTLTAIARDKGVVVSTIWWIKNKATWKQTDLPMAAVKAGRPFGAKDSVPRKK